MQSVIKAKNSTTQIKLLQMKVAPVEKSGEKSEENTMVVLGVKNLMSPEGFALLLEDTRNKYYKCWNT